MTDGDRSTEDLEQELLDERSQRVAAERRNAELTEAVATWRRRAEERKERIERLEAEHGGLLRRWFGTGRIANEGTVTAPPAARGSEAMAVPGLRATRVAGLVADPGMIAALRSMDLRTLSGRESVDDADLVVVEPAAFQAGRDRDALVDLLTGDLRPPIVVWGDDIGLAAKLGASAVHLPPSFDPATNSPASDWLVDAPPLVADPSRIARPDAALVQHAAGGGPVVHEDDPLTDPTRRSMASAVARRWAYRNHAPWVRGEQLLTAAGVDTFHPWPTATAVLVSNKPELLVDALHGLAGQNYPRLSVVVGLHGAGDAPAVEAMARDLGIADVLVLFVSVEASLGAALNRSIDAAGGDILLKIDDDDHYGPAYVEDAVHALIYSGAPIVGKAAQYTYFADRDSTVLRRAGTEETPITGMPTGASLAFRRSVWEMTRFPHRARQVDVHFVNGARLAGAEVYTSSRWEFRYYRRAAGHTWVAATDTLMAGSEPAFGGDHPGRTEARGWPIDDDR